MTIVSGKPVTLIGKATPSTDTRGGGEAFPLFLGARLCYAGCDKRLAFVLCHPAGDFTKYYPWRVQGAADVRGILDAAW
ncbi:hypothetical protein D3C87_1047990 [compost metagenome]